MSKHFGIFPTITELADDFDVPYVTAGAWVTRGEIPAKHDATTVKVCAKHGFIVTREQLDQWHASLKEKRKAERSGGSLPTPAFPWVMRADKCA